MSNAATFQSIAVHNSKTIPLSNGFPFPNQLGIWTCWKASKCSNDPTCWNGWTCWNGSTCWNGLACWNASTCYLVYYKSPLALWKSDHSYSMCPSLNWIIYTSEQISAVYSLNQLVLSQKLFHFTVKDSMLKGPAPTTTLLVAGGSPKVPHIR